MVVRNAPIVAVESGATIFSAPAVTVKSEISGVFMREGSPVIGARAYAYYAGEDDLIASAAVDKDGSWKIDTLPTTALYDIRFLGRDSSPADWLYNIQAYVMEEVFDVTPPDNSMVAVGGMEE